MLSSKPAVVSRGRADTARGESAIAMLEGAARHRPPKTRYGERPARALDSGRAGSSRRFALLGGAAKHDFEIARVTRIDRVNRHAETEG